MEKNDTEKQKIKDFTAAFILRFFCQNKIKKLKGLTLPGVTWNWERNLRKTLGMNKGFRISSSITGCEEDYKVFTLSATKMPGSHKNHLNPYFSDRLGHYVVTNVKEQVYLLNIDIFKLIANPVLNEQKYNCIWLDTTNKITSIARKIELIDRIMGENAIFILTILNGREHIKFDTGRIDYINQILNKMGFTLVHEKPYYDTCPMLHLIYTRTTTAPATE